MESRWIRAALGALMAAAIGGCGGGVQQDDGASDAPLTCGGACIDSSTLDTAQMRHSYALVSDGQQLQAQAGFSSGSDPRFNVALKGGDMLQLATPQGTQGFHVPAVSSSFAEILVDVFATALTGAKPYLSEVPTLPTATADYEFRFIRNGTTLAAPVTLPAPFSIGTPAANATLDISSPTLSVQVSSQGDHRFYANFSCTDANGNTAEGSEDLAWANDAPQTGTNGMTYTLALASAINGLQFSTAHPRGEVTACDVTLHAVAQNDGTASTAFADGSRVFAQQVRSVSFKLAAAN